MESMERIDVLKGIEQILVEKAYETGHISHRADGDWQKTNSGWVRIKDNSAQPTPQAQEPALTENTEYSEITEEDLIETPDIDYEKPVGKSFEWTENYLSGLGYKPTEKDENGRPTEYENDDWDTVHVTYDRLGYVTKIENEDEDSDEDIFSKESYEQDNEDRENMSAQDTVEHLIDNGDYDESFKSIVFIKNDDGEDEPQDDSYFAVADTIMNDVSEDYDFDEGDWEEGGDADNLYQYIVDRVIDKAYQFHTGDSGMGKAYSTDEIDRIKNIKKSAIRDMRSAPVTKNMGF